MSEDAARPGLPVFAAAVAVPLVYGGLSVWLGQDANWDLRNYHFYNPYALLNGRLDFDVAVAHQPTYYNPVSDLPFYFLVTSLPPRLTGFALGVIHGLNFILLLAIAWRLLATSPGTVRRWGAIVLAALGMAGAITLSEVGTTFHDNFLSLFVLGGILVLVLYYRQLVEAPLVRALAIAASGGLLSGLGVGLKQTMVIFAIGPCLALLLVTTGMPRRFGLAFAFGIGVLVGIAATGGYWMWLLWDRYGNPVLPHYNHIFKSPWAVVSDYVDRKYNPTSLVEALIFPFKFVTEPRRVAEVTFRDLRLPILYLLSGAAILALPLRGRWLGPGRVMIADRHPAILVMVASAIAYAAWLEISGVYRYLVPLEMLAPLLIVLVVDRLALPRWAHGAVLGTVLGASVATLVPGNWGRTAWSDDYFGVSAPSIPNPSRSIVLMTGLEPMAYVIPFFPPEVPFLRIDGWFTGSPTNPHRHDHFMRQRIAVHGGPIYVLFRAPGDRDRTERALAGQGLRLRHADCVTFKPHLDTEPPPHALGFCPVDRL